MEIESKVFSLFADFVRDLGKTYPEIKSCLNRNYEDILTESENRKVDDFPKLKTFLDLVYENQSLIREKDEKLFELEIELLEEISFKNLWSKNISVKTRGTIWKYLQTFSLITINLKSSEELREVLLAIQNDEIDEKDIMDKKVAKDLKNIKKLTKDVKDEDGDEDEIDLEKLMGGMMDSNIGNIAKEVAESMNIDEMLEGVDENSNPMEIMGKLMSSEKMGSIFQNIDSIMKNKMESGEITEDSLKEEAMGMMGKMDQNPLFGGMMQEMNKTTNGPTEGTDKKGTSTQTKGTDTNRTNEEKKKENREKIKKKINEKKKERTN